MSDVVWSINIMIGLLLIGVCVTLYWIFKYDEWYPKVKFNGIFSGHDWNSKDVEVAVNDFRRDNNIIKIMCTYDNTWVWMK